MLGLPWVMTAAEAEALLDRVIAALAGDDPVRLQQIATQSDGFPAGNDPYGRSWTAHAVECASPAALRWVLALGGDARFRDTDGYTALHLALERALPERHALLAMLIEAGAPLDARGSNDYTPLHAAAVSEDLEALRLLLDAGADPTRRTRIDAYAAPVEEALHLGKLKSVAFLEDRHPLRAADWIGRRLR